MSLLALSSFHQNPALLISFVTTMLGEDIGHKTVRL